MMIIWFSNNEAPGTGEIRKRAKIDPALNDGLLLALFIVNTEKCLRVFASFTAREYQFC